MATQIKYRHPEQGEQAGYIINGQTYKDPGGTARIDPGSVVTTGDGKQWMMTPSGGAPYDAGQYAYLMYGINNEKSRTAAARGQPSGHRRVCQSA